MRMKIIGAIAIITVLGIAASIGIGVTGAQSSCIDALTGDGTSSGTWSSDCISQNTPTEPTNPPSGTRYARYYSFTLTTPSDVTIELTSTEDTYLYLMEEIGTNGNVVHENDDAESVNTNSRIAASLQSGDYTIEATTFNLTTSGNFALTVRGLPVAPSTVEPVDPTPTQGPAIPTATPEPTPTQPPASVPTLTPASPPVMDAGPNHACALDGNGAISCDGLDSHGQVSLHPGSSGFKAISAGDNHTCAIDADSRIRCWGSNEYGQSSPPTHEGFIAIQSGSNYTCALRADREMECWGRFEAAPSLTPEITPEPTATPETTQTPEATHTPVPTSSPVPDPPPSTSCSNFVPNADLSGCDLTGQDLSDTDLSGAKFTEAILVDADLTGTTLTSADFSDADLSGADLSEADFRHAKFKDANLDRVLVAGTQFRSGNAGDDGSMFRGTTLTNIVFDPGLKLTSVGFINADLSYSHFIDVDLQSADLRNTTVTDTDFSGADFRNAKMKSFKLNSATIDSKTKFEGADLTKADLSGMDLSGVDFEDVELEGADLSKGTFEDGKWYEVNLSDADLTDAEFIDIDFDDADFDNAILDDVDFEDCDLTGAQNMDDAKDIHQVNWEDTTCPDGTNSDNNPNDSCYPNNLNPSN